VNVVVRRYRISYRNDGDGGYAEWMNTSLAVISFSENDVWVSEESNETSPSSWVFSSEVLAEFEITNLIGGRHTTRPFRSFRMVCWVRSEVRKLINGNRWWHFWFWGKIFFCKQKSFSEISVSGNSRYGKLFVQKTYTGTLPLFKLFILVVAVSICYNAFYEHRKSASN